MRIKRKPTHAIAMSQRPTAYVRGHVMSAPWISSSQHTN
eukprot:CAMPEP_0181180372 /NCGR_PEP_ID=MMETSP1096-20121128/6762_1 /TAXON_ID=156174 ORGANISM="Chrysochromulina ericina, Strain CCMP281" /NCGR_SAMPLE_ID=MMETSP1096 /ASSEMBLY_ACC=CAM_ASM_000453 /LENGTH=38 /DNA_ID= /DNA_START= /DNA_END= /DNA_ORIENTATION=